MTWKPAGRQGEGSLLHFLRKEEWKHVNLSSRIRVSGDKPRFGQIADGRLWIKDREMEISGALFISRFGVVLPSFDTADLSDPDRDFLRRILILRRDRLFSMIGTESAVRYLELCIGEEPADSENYRIFTGVEGTSDPEVLPPGVAIRKAGPQDLDKLWPLEKAYQLEEVLRKNSVLNERSARRHFLETLKEQLVYYASLNGRPVAKAGTNARGWNWDQIGGVFVIPELRGCGFGRSVMTSLLEVIRNSGKSPCLFVKESNPAALGLYHRLAFKDRGSFRITYWSH